MTVKEIWNSCLYTTLTVSIVMFFWSVGSSFKKMATTVDEWNPRNVESGVNRVIDHASNRANLVVNNAADRVEVAVSNTAIAINGVADHSRGVVRNIVAESAARCGVTFAEMVRIMYDANMGLGRHFVGTRPSDDRVRDIVRGVMVELEAEQQV